MKRAKKKAKKRTNCKIFFAALFIFVFSFVLIFMIGGNDKKEEIAKSDSKINLLVTGMDNDGLRTDLIMAASYDIGKNAVNVLLIPENTKMYVGGRYQKISAAHAIFRGNEAKGIAGTVEAVSRLCAIPFNYYIEFSQGDFEELIDMLGGIEFDVKSDMKYFDPTENLSIDIKKGCRIFGGEDALKIVRYASYAEDEGSRTLVQKEFLCAAVKQKFSARYIAKTATFLEKADISTNLSVNDIVKYSNMMLGVKAEDINFYICPGKSEKTQTTSYWIADTEALAEIIENVFGYDAENITTDKK